MPLSICSGGACTSVYISTVTSILSSFSLPLTLVVPILNYLGFVLQLVGLLSIYSANKWHSLAFWLYLLGMVLMAWLGGWTGCVLMILAVVLNAKTNRFVYGRKMFKETILWFIFRPQTIIQIQRFYLYDTITSQLISKLLLKYTPVTL